MYKISIITINYNNLKGLKKTIESVVSQTWEEFEYIVIDGGSTDGSAQYIKSQKHNLNYWVSEPDEGIYNAMNKGIVKATGDYLLFLNSGDHFFSNIVLQENHASIVKYDLIYFNIKVKGTNLSQIVSYPEKLRFSDFYLGTLCHQSTFIKKSLFDKFGLYDEKLKIVSDWKFFILALFKYDCSYFKVDSILTTYYLDGVSSDVVNKKIFYKEKQEILNCYFKANIDDTKELFLLREKISNLRKSKKIGLLIKLGLFNKF